MIELTQILFILGSDARFGDSGDISRPDRDLRSHHAIAIDWKSVVTVVVCLRRKPGTFGREQFGLPGLQVKDGLAAGAKNSL